MKESDAEYYQAHKDDAEEWGKPSTAKRRGSRRLETVVSVRFAPEEEEAIRRAAERRGEFLSAFVRRSALREAGLLHQPSFHSVTGSVVSAGSGDWLLESQGVPTPLELDIFAMPERQVISVTRTPGAPTPSLQRTAR
ncbi:MAG: DUF1778 domain-containing protein [Actinobacteria bacterium]|nr:DUF1778 domain-containing protein [Actinomycetota bacterium]